MTRSHLLAVARHAADHELPDAELLRRFVASADHPAFAELVRRHARLVWGQCRNLLASDADADDAFQATFLTLAKSADAIREADRLGPWLHGVAYHVCKNARRAAARRAKREHRAAVGEAVRPVADSAWDAAAAVVHEEVSRLPDTLRVPFVLCVLEGVAPTDAAERLGLKWGTFAARLSRAKRRLLDRLSARGIGAAVAISTLGLVNAAPPSVVLRALSIASAGATVPASVLSLCPGGNGMVRAKLFTVLAVAALGVGAMFLPGDGPPPVPLARAAPVPKEDPQTKEGRLKEAWADLASSDDLIASRALLVLREHATAAFFAAKLKPLKLTEDEAKKLLADLGSEDEKTWKAAYEELGYHDPRLAIGLDEITKLMWKSQALDERLAALLSGKLPAEADACRWCKTEWTFYKMPGKEATAATMMVKNHPDKPAEFETMLDKQKQPGIGIAVPTDVKSMNTFRTNPSWRRAVRAVAVLEALGTDEAKAVLKGMADGHPDAGPTVAAKASLERPKR